ncbi:hypothetical protein L2E82_20966 [Cichorium intybus]|uniref:Uncharacterized protein n=1 Tax=Cichorium intybus TaxID=13427 RepID=A0ACB9DUW0_CICIN|nr:hypothetical protein L2E82_20966 [Cichorium intybus]
MVAFASIACLNGNNGGVKKSPNEQPTSNPLGILAFEAAKNVSRLLSLYKSLSDPEIVNLRKDIFKSKGVVYLNSDDEGYLLKLACAEKIEDLDKAAIVVATLARKCSDFMLNSFDMVYADIKLGTTDLRKYEYGSNKTKKNIRKLKRFLSATLGLYGSMHCPPGMEAPEKKMNSPVPFMNMKLPAIEWRITQPRKHPVNHTKTNLWTLPFEKVVRLMSTIVCVIYARICMVFGPYVPDIPSAYTSRQKHVHVTAQMPSELWLIEPRTPDNKSPRSRLWIVEPKSPRSKLVRTKSRKNTARLNPQPPVPTGGAKTDQVFHDAGPNTVGGSRLQILYANLIMMAEENMVRKTIKDDVRDEMYRMMPENMRAMVKVKIRGLKDCKGNNGGKQMKESLRSIFMWLSPMAHNTLLWARERRVEMTRIEARPPVLLLQTLHFSDKEKTEAAIVEVLVGLSVMYMQQNRRVPAA